jgi:hypothetical protein
MNHDRFPLPGEQERIEPAQYHLDPTDPEQADLAAFYAQDTHEPVQTLPEPVAPVVPRETGQFTGLMPERPAEQPHYAMPDAIAAYHQDFAAKQAAEARRAEMQQDYLLAPPQRPETQTTQPINEGRFGFRALRGAVRRMRQR